MSANSTIEWTDATWNPVRGCTKISPGCKHCYAETFAERFRGVPGHAYEHGFDLHLAPHKLLDPVRLPKPKRIFVNSMSDLFQAGVPEKYIELVAEVMTATPWHTYQVLTKRSDRMQKLLSGRLRRFANYPHILWGVSVENRRHGVPRIQHFQNTPVEKRFLSIEPLLEDIGHIDLRHIDWVIVGGESGAGARPVREEWVLSIHEQCRAARVPFFFKQWGGVQKSRHGRQLLGSTFDEQPSVDTVAIYSRKQRKEIVAELADKNTNFILSSHLSMSATIRETAR